MNIQTNIPLSTMTTMRLGGTASYVADITSIEELQQIYLNSAKLKLPVYIIGGGSNLIVHDDGFAGVIAHMKIPGIEIEEDNEETTTISAGAGVIWDDLVKFSVDRTLAGIEAMSGIPGTVGAAPVQNIGAYGQELADTLISLRAYDISKNTFVTLSANDCGFSYRQSVFRGNLEGKYVIVSITLKLYKIAPQPPFYDSLQQYFDDQNTTLFNVQVVRDAVLNIRAKKLPDPRILPNAGSFFKNIIVEDWKRDELLQQYPEMPSFQLDETNYKIPAGWLIDTAYLKGETIHGIKVHDDNAVVLINQSATSYEDLALAREEIIGAVRDKFRITLVQEPLELTQNRPMTNN
ncbi:MAG: UDP-N-acetylmuramate dehydrogenase [Candidatus Saccharimonadales bacterium]